MTCVPRITLPQHGRLQTALRKIVKKTHLSRALHRLKKSTSTWIHVVHTHRVARGSGVNPPKDQFLQQTDNTQAPRVKTSPPGGKAAAERRAVSPDDARGAHVRLATSGTCDRDHEQAPPQPVRCSVKNRDDPGRIWGHGLSPLPRPCRLEGKAEQPPQVGRGSAAHTPGQARPALSAQGSRVHNSQHPRTAQSPLRGPSTHTMSTAQWRAAMDGHTHTHTSTW